MHLLSRLGLAGVGLGLDNRLVKGEIAFFILNTEYEASLHTSIDIRVGYMKQLE